nr:hypothetical protein [Tanacetum cinerariifolium]
MQTRSSSRLVNNQSSNPTSSTNPNPKGRNRRRSKQRIENLNLEDISPPVVTMVDQRTMAQLLQAPTEGYEDAIVVLAITADNFELKHGLLTLVQNKQFFGHDKEDPHAHIRYFNKITSTLKFSNVPNTSIKLMLFPFSLVVFVMKSPISNNDLIEAWDRFKDIIRDCPQHGFSELHQLDTFYNALNSKYQDSLNSAAGGNFLDKMPRECLAIIESKFKVRYSRDKPVVAKVSTNASTSGVSPDNALNSKYQDSLNSAAGGNFLDKMPRECLAIIKSKFKVRYSRDKPVVAKVSTNASTSGVSPDVVELKDMVKALILDKKGQNQSPAPVKAVEESCVTCGGPVYQPPVFQPPAYQAPAYQAPAPQTQSVSKEDFSTYVKANDAVMKNMQTQGQNMQNQLANLTDLFTKFVNFNSASTSSSGTLPSNTIANPKSDLKAITTRSGVSYDGPQISPKVVENEPYPVISEPAIGPVSASKPNLKASIPYPSKRNDERNRIVECLALADLGANINIMPFYMWKILSLPDLTPTCMTLELADRLISHPVGVAEDVYIKVGSIHFPADFVVVDFDADPRVPLILERSFLKTERALIDVFEEVDAFLAIEDEPTSSEFHQSYLNPEGDVLLLEAFLNDDPLLPPSNQRNYLPEVRKELKICEAKSDKSSVDEPLVVELKVLPPHIEYGFLEGDDKLPVIIVKDLSVEEKTALLTVLKSHKRAIAWNPKIHDVIKQEVIKLLDVRLICPISDSPWVSPVHCVPKKGGFTVVENEDNELIPTRLVTGWRVCINYRKLNEATRKDDFPLSFMDQMLEKLAGNQYYCFLDGFSGYFQI